MRINIVVPPFASNRFTGGIWCVLQHAQQLVARNHRVTIVPTHPSPPPEWFPKPWFFTLCLSPPRRAAARGLGGLVDAFGAGMRFKLSRAKVPPAAVERAIRGGLADAALAIGNYGRHGERVGTALDHLAQVLPEADVTLATDCETALPVCLAGRGALAYFAQHYEVYFWKERLGGEASRREAQLSYRLGLRMLANSPWLQGLLEQETGQPVLLCPNAIDHVVFDGEPRARAPGEPLRIISYGGRGAEWKGFREMCEAMRIVRLRHPALPVEWAVYGDALLPPDNPVSGYKALGFLSPPALAAAYRGHHALLSASWYESFPLFPIEAMACGLAAITTQPGTEAFAEHEHTAWVVPPRQPEALAAAIVRLAEDEPFRLRLARDGRERSRQFTWERAGAAMESALLQVAAVR